MATLAVMKSRILQEFRRVGDSEFEQDIGNAISTAIDTYKYQRFSFNQAAFVDAPADDGETGNAWMTTAERLIRARAKLHLVINVLEQPDAKMAEQLNAEVEEALATLRMAVSNNDTATAGTRGYMKLRIKNEINRSDIDFQIANAINDAIDAYQATRYYFNETREFTFTTVDGQRRYDANDSGWENLANVMKIDFVYITLNGLTYECWARPPEYFESITTQTTNTPSYYGWYEESLALHPTPNTATEIRIGCVCKVAAPASDATTGNAWMTKAERMIRARAKAILYLDCDQIRDPKKAAEFMALADEAEADLNRETLRKTQVGPMLIQAFD